MRFQETVIYKETWLMLQSLDVRPDEAQKENVGHNKVAITSRTNKRI